LEQLMIRKFLVQSLVSVVASFALVAVAVAASSTPTEGPDNLRGTASADTIAALGGDDKVAGRAGDDDLDGGSGDDRLRGGKGADSVSGGEGNDRLTGNQGVDSLDGGAGDDRINGRGDGRKADEVTCGDGEDSARLDRNDVIADASTDDADGSCESVRRTGKGHGKGKGQARP
jgi:Ca2+-binding RTX toxin-like protein